MPVFFKYLFYEKYFFCVIFGIVFALYISNMKTKSQNKGENKMETFTITLEVTESSEEMAYQLLALAIKKKYKDRVRPYFDSQTCLEIDREEVWQERSGQPYDY